MKIFLIVMVLQIEVKTIAVVMSHGSNIYYINNCTMLMSSSVIWSYPRNETRVLGSNPRHSFTYFMFFITFLIIVYTTH